MSSFSNCEPQSSAASRWEQPESSGRPIPVTVREAYERWAPSYDCTANPLLAREERYLLPLLPNLHHKHVLDVACGTGRWLERLMARGARQGVGVDLSSAMLEIAGRKTAIAGSLIRADCLRLPFRASVFDFAICSFAVGHIPDLRGLVRELARVMKPNADVFVSDLHSDAYARGWRTGFRDARSAVEIEALPRRAEQIIPVFYSGGFECLTHVPLCLGEPEKPIFAQAKKQDQFEAASRVPAVLCCRFKRVASAGPSGDGR